MEDTEKEELSKLITNLTSEIEELLKNKDKEHISVNGIYLMGKANGLFSVIEKTDYDDVHLMITLILSMHAIKVIAEKYRSEINDRSNGSRQPTSAYKH